MPKVVTIKRVKAESNRKQKSILIKIKRFPVTASSVQKMHHSSSPLLINNHGKSLKGYGLILAQLDLLTLKLQRPKGILKTTKLEE